MGANFKYPKAAGIYKLTCANNGKIYIGKSINIKKRLGEHRRAKGGYHLHNAISKHGWDSFNVEILEIFKIFDKLKDNNTLLEIEADYIKLFDSTDPSKGYNLCKYSTDSTGRIASRETREKMSKAKLGNTIWLGKTHSEESKEKVRQANLGKSGFKHSQISIEKMKLSKLGKNHSDQTKLKISRSKKGSKHNKVGVNKEATLEYYSALDNYLKNYGVSLNNNYLNLNFDEVGIFVGDDQIGDISLKISRNILHLKGLNFICDGLERSKFLDIVYNFHFEQKLLKKWNIKIYTNIDNTIDVFKKTFKNFNFLRRNDKIMTVDEKVD